MFESIGDTEGRLDIVVANAAATAFKPLLETKRHHIEKTFGITVGGFMELVKAAVSLMPGGGSIVAVSGFDAIRVLENHGSLGAAKAAMVGAVDQPAMLQPPGQSRLSWPAVRAEPVRRNRPAAAATSRKKLFRNGLRVSFPVGRPDR